jgi:hypothetical protein
VTLIVSFSHIKFTRPQTHVRSRFPMPQNIDPVLVSRQHRADSYVLIPVGTLLIIVVCNILGCRWPKRPVSETLTA